MKNAVATWTVMVVGVGLIVIAAIRAFDTTDGAAVIALLAGGVLLLLSPLLHDFQFSGGGVALRLNFSKEIAELGAPKAAKLLEASGLSKSVEHYQFVSQELGDRYDDCRKNLQDALVDRASAVARTEKLDAQEVRQLFAEGQPLVRVLALGLMKGDISLADQPSNMSAIEDWRTPNESYHGLRLAWFRWKDLSPDERGAILAAAKSDKTIQGDADRRLALEDIEVLNREYANGTVEPRQPST